VTRGRRHPSARAAALLGFCFAALGPGSAFACGMCGFDMARVNYPASTYWFFIALAWFFAQSCVVEEYGLCAAFPKFCGAILLILGAGAAAAALLGPIVAIPLALWTLCAWPFLNDKPGRDPDRPFAHRRWLNAFGGVAIALMIAAGVHGWWGWNRMSAGERLVALGPNAFTVQMRHDLAAIEPPVLEEFRKIVADADPNWDSFRMAARKLGEFGDPAIDATLLRNAVARHPESRSNEASAAIARLEERAAASLLKPGPAPKAERDPPPRTSDARP
jgi:hypothetical protein